MIGLGGIASHVVSGNCNGRETEGPNMSSYLLCHTRLLLWALNIVGMYLLPNKLGLSPATILARSRHWEVGGNWQMEMNAGYAILFVGHHIYTDCWTSLNFSDPQLKPLAYFTWDTSTRTLKALNTCYSWYHVSQQLPTLSVYSRTLNCLIGSRGEIVRPHSDI